MSPPHDATVSFFYKKIMKYIIGKEYMYFGNFAKLIDIQGEEPHRLFILSQMQTS